MKKNMEKRNSERWKHTALIAFSYFNQGPSFDTQALNHGLDGMVSDDISGNLFELGMLSIYIEKTERNDTTNLSAFGGSIFNSRLSERPTRLQSSW